MNRVPDQESQPEEPSNLCLELLILLAEYQSDTWLEKNKEFWCDPVYLIDEIISILNTESPSEGIDLFRRKWERKLEHLIVSDNFPEEMERYISEWRDPFCFLRKSSLNQEQKCKILIQGFSRLTHQQLLDLLTNPNDITAIKEMWEVSHENVMLGKAWQPAFMETHPASQLLDEIFDEHQEGLKKIFPDRHSDN